MGMRVCMRVSMRGNACVWDPRRGYACEYAGVCVGMRVYGIHTVCMRVYETHAMGMRVYETHAMGMRG